MRPCPNCGNELIKLNEIFFGGAAIGRPYSHCTKCGYRRYWDTNYTEFVSPKEQRSNRSPRFIRKTVSEMTRMEYDKDDIADYLDLMTKKRKEVKTE